MTTIKEAYNQWSLLYDTNQNKTRDLEAKAIRSLLDNSKFRNTLEIGCGTGKNTIWLSTISEEHTAVDFSEEMLRKARLKIASHSVQFVEADINHDWNFAKGLHDLINPLSG
jgi:ubiquinone/menaquinone biosynthesis C-methylase UbiE